jgi:hypothetical protein
VVTPRLLASGHPVPGAPILATWRYRTTTSYCSGKTGTNGVAACGRHISRATHGYTVRIDVAFSYYVIAVILAVALTYFLADVLILALTGATGVYKTLVEILLSGFTGVQLIRHHEDLVQFLLPPSDDDDDGTPPLLTRGR